MTIEEKRKAIREYCNQKPLCNTGYTCPLFELPPGSCSSPDDETIERNFKLVSEMPDYKGKKEEPQEPTKTYGHDGCIDCKYEDKCADEEPCASCKGNSLFGTKEYETRPDNYEPIEEVKEDPYIKLQNRLNEMVDHPSHYNQGGMETIEEMELIFGVEVVMDFCLLNAWKYRARAAYKGKPEEDMDKANWYLNKYKELMEREYGK